MRHTAAASKMHGEAPQGRNQHQGGTKTQSIHSQLHSLPGLRNHCPRYEPIGNRRKKSAMSMAVFGRPQGRARNLLALRKCSFAVPVSRVPAAITTSCRHTVIGSLRLPGPVWPAGGPRPFLPFVSLPVPHRPSSSLPVNSLPSSGNSRDPLCARVWPAVNVGSRLHCLSARMRTRTAGCSGREHARVWARDFLCAWSFAGAKLCIGGAHHGEFNGDHTVINAQGQADV